MINPLYDDKARYAQLKKTIELLHDVKLSEGNAKVLEYHATLTYAEVMFINTLRIQLMAHNIQDVEVFKCETFNELLKVHHERKNREKSEYIESLKHTDIAAYIAAKKVLRTKKEENYYTKLYTLCDAVEKYYKNINHKDISKSMFSIFGREYDTPKGKMFEGIKIFEMSYQNSYRIQVSGIIGGTFDVCEQKLYSGLQVTSKTRVYHKLPDKKDLINDILCEWFLITGKTAYRHSDISSFSDVPNIKRDAQGNRLFVMSDVYAYPIYLTAQEYLANITDAEIDVLINKKLPSEICFAFQDFDDE